MLDLTHAWTAIGPFLDRALDLSDVERSAWLKALRLQDATLAADLELLLDEHAAVLREGFLEEPVPQALGAGPLAGTTAGAYTLASPIGRGGMGSVWARHPNIAHLIDAGVCATGQPYLVLEYVDGEPIDRHCSERGLEVTARLRLVLEMLAAVAHAHANLVVHRDIKPSNVLVSREGQVKLLDPRNSLTPAVHFSRVWSSLSALYRSSGRTDLASSLEARRLDLWHHLESKLPGNPFVLRQLAEAHVN